MAGLTYNTFVTQLAELAVVPLTVGVTPVTTQDSDFNAVIPSAIEYAENRICRDLDLLSTVVASTATLTPSVPQLVIAYATTGGNWITIQNINVITPSGTVTPNSGTRNPVLPVSKEFLQYTWPSATGAGIPLYFCLQGGDATALGQGATSWTINLGPWPDSAYTVELIGTIRPATLSSTNPVTFISTFLADLMLQAAMIFISGYQRNFGKQSDDPAMALSYETQYQTLLKGATGEEYRKKFAADAWTSMSSSPVATQGR